MYRYVGTCPVCKAGLAVNEADAGDHYEGDGDDTITAYCTEEGCYGEALLKFVVGTLDDKSPCDIRCEFATGVICKCACGGAHHGIGNTIHNSTRDDAARENDEKVRKAALKRSATRKANAALKAPKVTAADRRRAALVETNPELAGMDRYADAREGSFMASMHKAYRAGKMSEKQIECSLRQIRTDAHRARLGII